MNNTIGVQPGMAPLQRLNLAVNEGVEQKPGASMFEEKFERVEHYVSRFTNHKNALHITDHKGNAVTTVPGLGSLKKTADGFEMCVLTQTHKAANRSFELGIGMKDGLYAKLDNDKGKMEVREGHEIVGSGYKVFSALTGRETESYTLDLNEQSIRGYEKKEVPPDEKMDWEIFEKDLTKRGGLLGLFGR